jgi:AcrR family transcriptional regulator
MTTRIKRKERITRTRRRQILRAALSVFSTKGYGESTMADVAQSAGVGVGTLYNYYKNKRDLLISLVQSLLISEGLINILDKMGGQSNRQLMELLLEDRLEFAIGNAQTILFLFFEIQRDARLRKQYLQQVIGPVISKLQDFIRFQVNSGAFRNIDERIIARTMVGSLIGSAMLYVLEQRESPFKKSQLKEIAHEMSGLFLDGLVKK